MQNKKKSYLVYFGNNVSRVVESYLVHRHPKQWMKYFYIRRFQHWNLKIKLSYAHYLITGTGLPVGQSILEFMSHKFKFLPIVGMVVTISPSFNLYKMVVLPAASRPTIKILISFFPKRFRNNPANMFPILNNEQIINEQYYQNNNCL